LSKVEIESFLKSFLLFFISLGTLLGILFYLNYQKDVQTLDEQLFSQMRVCSFDLKCEKFNINFVQKDKELYKLYKDKNGLSSFYPIPNSKKYIMLINFTQKDYKAELEKLRTKAKINFSIVLGVVFLLSILFSFYALSPLRNALSLTQEFIKDILHDFNTPLASLRLNTSMLKDEIGDNTKLTRIENGVENILSLQSHLRSYLLNHSLEKEEFSLEDMLLNSLKMIEKNYPSIKYKVDAQNIKIVANKEAFSRIIENILSNAFKYNKKGGLVDVSFSKGKLYISDTGIGIKKPKKVFNRFYKENDRGIGIGLHIVKKLCDELKINIEIKSKVDEGTTFILHLPSTMLINS
jgi:signal transduction histidine kinase